MFSGYSFFRDLFGSAVIFLNNCRAIILVANPSVRVLLGSIFIFLNDFRNRVGRVHLYFYYSLFPHSLHLLY